MYGSSAATPIMSLGHRQSISPAAPIRDQRYVLLRLTDDGCRCARPILQCYSTHPAHSNARGRSPAWNQVIIE